MLLGQKWAARLSSEETRGFGAPRAVRIPVTQLFNHTESLMLAFLLRFPQRLAERPAGGVEQSLKFWGFAVPMVGLEPPGLWPPRPPLMVVLPSQGRIWPGLGFGLAQVRCLRG